MDETKIVYKSFSNKFRYKVLRDIPLYYLDEEEFNFVIKLLLNLEGETS